MTNTFTEDFPELKVIAYFEDGKQKEPTVITENSIPNLVDKARLYLERDIQAHCLSKQRFLEARIDLYNDLQALGTVHASPMIKRLFKKFDRELGLE